MPITDHRRTWAVPVIGWQRIGMGLSDGYPLFQPAGDADGDWRSCLRPSDGPPVGKAEDRREMPFDRTTPTGAFRVFRAYLVTNRVNGKQYIGVIGTDGKTVEKRWREHCY